MRRDSELHDFSLLFNLLKRVEFSDSTSFAVFTGLSPGFGRLEVAVPKWPSLALPWPETVDVAIAICTIKEDAVTVGEFLEAFADPNFAYEVFFELVNFHFERASKSRDLFFIDPDESRCSSAAIAASTAFEFEPVFVPGFFVGFLCHESRSRVQIPRLSGSKSVWVGAM